MRDISATTRERRAVEVPIVDGLPKLPGIRAAMALSPALGEHLRGIAQVLLVNDFPGATLSRGEREVIATAVSAGNECCFCTDSHAAFARELGRREGRDFERCLPGGKKGATPVDPKLQSLVDIAEMVRESGLIPEAHDVEFAKEAGATDGDVQVAILIAAAFSMFNRMVDGLRATTPTDQGMYRESALRIAERGYQEA